MNAHLKSIAASLLLLAGIAPQLGAKPNLVVLMADDIGLGDISFFQRQRSETPVLETPNIDKLISQGMRFTDAHSPASLCAPTRFSMLTGNYSYRNHNSFGVWTPEAESGIEPGGFTTSARIAKAGGYQTAFFGKWGLGSSWLSKIENWEKEDGGALHFGFDYACELPEGIQNKPYAFYENQVWMKLGPDSVMKELDADQTCYATSKKLNDRGGMGDSNWDPSKAGPVLAKKGMEYIKKHAGNPFFMYYCSQAVHIPHEPPVELDGIKIAGTTPGKHSDMVKELDVQTGMLVRALKKAGVYDHTLFIFTSDNGGLSMDLDSSNGLSGKKGSIMEGGHRVPFVAVWPGKIKPGSVSDEPIIGHDVVATIAALAGQPIDRNMVKDSMNLLPVLQGHDVKERHSNLMHQSAGGPSWAIRDGDWKLIMKASTTIKDFKFKPEKLLQPGIMEPIGLYNLKTDLYEKNNLLKNPEYKPRVDAMLNRCIELRKTKAPTVGE
ncbi:sulfatase family protein [Pontiella sulfatireligans]|uniref:Arylsulfatase n=1 Tax=Pontiella sulfatireligans TaxID=2750658 RepID=A0A6C2UK57_9BACT|nr:arylsulfatase [Pontiella sulfatireligans]SPS74421.1 sulfatase S1_15 [Kiritimatiellales bacterium]VGO20488.1 Arylsulfatase [Pontiella sulfatireligans]